MSKKTSIRKPRKIAFVGKVKSKKRIIQKEKKIISDLITNEKTIIDKSIYLDEISEKLHPRQKINKWLDFGFWFYIIITILVISVRFMYFFIVYVLGIVTASMTANKFPINNAEFVKLFIWIIYDLGLLFVLMVLYKRNRKESQGKE